MKFRLVVSLTFLVWTVSENAVAKEGQSRFAPHLQQHLWPGSTTADTRLAHSSASDDFRTSRRHLLGNTQTSAQAEKGVGVISYRPVGFNIDGDDFALFFLRAHANNRSTGIKIGYGTYHVTPSIEHEAHLYMECSYTRDDDFEVDLTGVFFYFTKRGIGGLAMKKCSNLYVHGPFEQTYTTDQLSYAQGTIVGTDEDKLQYTVEVDEGYPAETIMLHKSTLRLTFYFGNSQLVKPWPLTVGYTTDDGGSKLGERKYSFKTRDFTPNITVGDLVVAVDADSATGILFEDTTNCTVRDATVYHSGGYGVFGTNSQNTTFLRLQVRPFPRPLGKDGKLPLLSSSIDGFHVANGRSGLFLRDSYIVNSGDDAIALHGSYFSVAVTDAAAKTVIFAAEGSFQFDVGDTLVFYAADTERLGSASVVKMYSVEQPAQTSGKVAGKLQMNEANFMKVLLNSWPKNFKRLRFGDLAASPSRYSGFAIVNSTAGNLRGRGVLCKASDGVIAHNRFFNLMGYALQMSPEFYWNEADYVNNVLVINNTVNSYGGGMFLGDSPLDCSDPPSAYTNNYNVDFVNNTIANCAANPFVLTSAAGVSVINTSFVNVLCSSMDIGECNSWEVKGAIAMVANVRDVTFAGNNVVIDANCKLPQGSYDHPVALVNATNVTGLRTQSSISSLLQPEG